MPRPRRRSLFLLLAATADALVIRLEAGARECFLLDVSKEAAVSGNFELISEGVTPEPLGVVVSGAAGAVPLYETHGQPDGTFAFDVADDGVVDLCSQTATRRIMMGARGPSGLPFELPCITRRPTAKGAWTRCWM